jgi:hypothetical protein
MNKKAPFNFSDSDLQKSEFDAAIQSLVEKGMVSTIVIDGEIHYQITDLGIMVGSHIDSDPSGWN